ncbi:hypothetical protein [Streptomyces tritici]|uniref:hypothetical protein n=1 Tax=Streptomyces tritici TaxID=2054410 RepID=UPI003AF0784E
MRRFLTTFAVSTLVAGTVLIGTDRLTASSVRTERLDTVGRVTCDIPQMQADIRRLRAEAAELDRAGKRAAATKARATADGTERLMRACIDGDRDLSKPRW